jgi:hypothetical protein
VRWSGGGGDDTRTAIDGLGTTKKSIFLA